MARPELDDEFGEGGFAGEFDGEEPSAPWHNSTPAVVGASVAGLAVIGILVAAVMFVTRQDSSPGAPVDFVEPSFSSAAANTPATSTTETITSTAPISTTEINAPTSPSTTSGSSEATSSGSSSSEPVTRPRERPTDESSGAPTSRRPRFNITRTLAPQQAG